MDLAEDVSIHLVQLIGDVAVLGAPQQGRGGEVFALLSVGLVPGLPATEDPPAGEALSKGTCQSVWRSCSSIA